jgi:hypothetical protein
LQRLCQERFFKGLADDDRTDVRNPELFSERFAEHMFSFSNISTSNTGQLSSPPRKAWG